MPKASVATDRVDLKRRGAAYSGIAPNLEVKPAYWNAVLKAYGVKPLEHRIAAGTHIDQAFSEIWHDLAMSLLRVHVRAFALRGRAGRKQQSHRIRYYFYPFASEARLVQLVDHFKSEIDRSGRRAKNRDAFRIILKTTAKYQWRYRDRRMMETLEEAWKKIPKDVRERPSDFLPPEGLRPMPTTGGGVISPEQIADLNHLLEALPPLPEPKKR
jgi:hypothetical protein